MKRMKTKETTTTRGGREKHSRAVPGSEIPLALRLAAAAHGSIVEIF
jgi:hypothetical protein